MHIFFNSVSANTTICSNKTKMSTICPIRISFYLITKPYFCRVLKKVNLLILENKKNKDAALICFYQFPKYIEYSEFLN